MDKLQNRAFLFKRLLDIQYIFTIGKKGEAKTITLAFEEESFPHLVGLHYLTDLRFLSGGRKEIFYKIIRGEITYEKICKSDSFFQIRDRIDAFIGLETFLDKENTIFHMHQQLGFQSLIKADYLLSEKNTLDLFLFIDFNPQTGHYFCKSFYPNGKPSFAYRLPRYTLLHKEKINIRTGEKITLFDRLGNTVH